MQNDEPYPWIFIVYRDLQIVVVLQTKLDFFAHSSSKEPFNGLIYVHQSRYFVFRLHREGEKKTPNIFTRSRSKVLLWFFSSKILLIPDLVMFFYAFEVSVKLTHWHLNDDWTVDIKMSVMKNRLRW